MKKWLCSCSCLILLVGCSTKPVVQPQPTAQPVTPPPSTVVNPYLRQQACVVLNKLDEETAQLAVYVESKDAITNVNVDGFNTVFEILEQPAIPLENSTYGCNLDSMQYQHTTEWLVHLEGDGIEQLNQINDVVLRIETKSEETEGYVEMLPNIVNMNLNPKRVEATTEQMNE